MASQHSSQGGGPGPVGGGPAPDPRYTAAFHSDPNPWDQAGYRRAAAGRVKTARSLGLLILLLGIAILAAAAFYASTPSGDSQELAAPVEPAPSQTAVPASPVTSPAPAPASTTTEAAPLPETTVPTVSASQTEPVIVEAEIAEMETTTAAPVDPVSLPEPETAAPTAVFLAPEHAQQCAANVNWRIYSATEATSCPFSENVAIAMADNAGTDQSATVRVDSPVTGLSYQMQCDPESHGSFTCRGGRDAVVVLEHRHDL